MKEKADNFILQEWWRISDVNIKAYLCSSKELDILVVSLSKIMTNVQHIKKTNKQWILKFLAFPP